MFIAGYRFNNGDMSNLTVLQRNAIIIMKNNQRKHNLKNKAFLVVD